MTSSAFAANINLSNPISSSEKRHLSKTRAGGRDYAARQRALDQFWEVCLLPPQVKALVLASARPVDLRTLARFWTAPALSDCVRSDQFRCCTRPSWFLALKYLRSEKMQEAKNLPLPPVQACASLVGQGADGPP